MLKYRIASLILVVILSLLWVQCNPDDPNSSKENDNSTASPNSSDSSTIPSGSLDEQIESVMEKYYDKSGKVVSKFPSLMVAYRTATTSGDVSLGGASSKTVFPIGSLTKLFTGLLLAHLVSSSKVDLEDKVSDLLTSVSFGGEGDKSITLEQLITHTAGLKDFPGNLSFKRDDGSAQDPTSPARDYSLKMLKACIKKWSTCMDGVDAGTFDYSNLGIGLLAIAMQDLENHDEYSELLEDLIGKSMGLKYTGSNNTSYLSSVSKYLSKIYQGKKLISSPDMGVLAGAGELFSNGEDLDKLLKTLLGQGSSKLSKTVTEFHKELLKKGFKSSFPNRSFAYGVAIDNEKGSLVYSKDGVTAGSHSIIMWNPDKEIGLAILTNRGEANSESHTLNTNITKLAKSILALLDENKDSSAAAKSKKKDGNFENYSDVQFQQVTPWPKGQVKIFFQKTDEGNMGSMTMKQRQAVITQCKVWGKHANVSCVPQPTKPTSGNYVHAYNNLESGKSPCAAQGGFGYAKSKLVLGSNCYDDNILLHEIGHLLGFGHEHKRADRDEYIKVNLDNFQKGMESSFDPIAETKFKSGEYRSMKDSKGKTKYPYDLSSIMHYPTWLFSTCKETSSGSAVSSDCKTPTYKILPPNDKKKHTPFTDLSQGDIEYVQAIYGAK